MQIQEKMNGGEIVVYEKVSGDYSQAGTVSNRMYYTLLLNDTLTTSKGFGVFYDDPQKVHKSKLRSDVGCIIEGMDSLKVERLKKKYQVKVLPHKEYAVVEFPFEGHLSILMGLNRVHPAIDKYFEEKGYSPDSPVTEIYDMKNEKIIYRKEIARK